MPQGKIGRRLATAAAMACTAWLLLFGLAAQAAETTASPPPLRETLLLLSVTRGLDIRGLEQVGTETVPVPEAADTTRLLAGLLADYSYALEFAADGGQPVRLHIIGAAGTRVGPPARGMLGTAGAAVPAGSALPGPPDPASLMQAAQSGLGALLAAMRQGCTDPRGC